MRVYYRKVVDERMELDAKGLAQNVDEVLWDIVQSTECSEVQRGRAFLELQRREEL